MKTFINATLVLKDEIKEKASFLVDNGYFKEINPLENKGEVIDLKGAIVMPGFIDIHIHGTNNIDFMDANPNDYKTVSKSLYSEGVTTYIATTLTSDFESLKQVCQNVKIAKEENPSLGGIHLEGPYISSKYKGAQNEEFIRNPNIEEIKLLQEVSGNNIRYITLAPEKQGAFDFIKSAKELNVVSSAGHSDASFKEIEEAIECGLSNTTHTHNAMSGHHHRNPGIVTASMYFDNLFTEVICDGIHVCPETIKTFYKIVGSDRFIIITDALKIKNTDVQDFTLFGLPCIKQNNAAYLKSGPLAGSILRMDQGLRNMKKWCNLDLVSLSKISSLNAARSLHLDKVGEIKENYKADFVVLDKELNLLKTFKLGEEVYSI